MTYLIRGASEADGTRKDFLIRDRKIVYSAKGMGHLKSMELNCAGFLITPSRVAVDDSILQSRDFSTGKDKFIELQRLGITTILAVCSVQSERDLRQQLKQARHHLINSSLDYVIGISFPMRKLTPGFIRLCRRERVPFVLAVIESAADLEAVTWPWIRDALFWYRLAIVPDWRKLHDLSERHRSKLERNWRKIAVKHDIPTIADFPCQRTILRKAWLRKIGISPHKGELRIGSDLDYNLFRSGSLADPVELHYDKNSFPDVVVLRGKLMKAGKTVYYRPGFGKEVSIRVPGYLTSYPGRMNL